MPKSSRRGDLWAGICCCHPPAPCVGMAGPIVTASSDTEVNGRGQARLFDITIGFCGHPGIIVGASGASKSNGKGKATVGSPVVGCNIGVVITGSDNHNSGW